MRLQHAKLAAVAVAIPALALAAPPARADIAPFPSYNAPGTCSVWASEPVRQRGHVTGWGENICAYPSSVSTTEAGIEYKKCFIICYWTKAANMNGPRIGRPGTQKDTINAVIPWHGRHTYRVYVHGTCFNCRSPQGGQYGPEVKLR